MRFIEVVANVRGEQEIEGYETTLELMTSGGRRSASFEDALKLREAVLGLLKQSGLTDAEIREGGGEAGQSYWSTTRDVIHRISIRHEKMDVLASAMAATERHFAGLPRRFFGGTSQNFTFHPPVPIYSTIKSVDDALHRAIQHARHTAERIAVESGCRLGDVISVVEAFPDRRQESKSGVEVTFSRGRFVDFGSVDDDSLGEGAYQSLPKNRANATRRYHVRYAIEGAEQSPGTREGANPG